MNKQKARRTLKNGIFTREDGVKCITLRRAIIVLDEVYNDFENRICKNCKYYEEYSSVCCNGDSPLCADVVDKDFGCNKFEAK